MFFLTFYFFHGSTIRVQFHTGIENILFTMNRNEIKKKKKA